MVWVQASDLSSDKSFTDSNNLSESDPIYSYQPLWGSWMVESLIGEGSYGKVYKAVRKDLKYSFTSAIKIIRIPSKDQYKQAISSFGDDIDTLKGYFEEIVEDILNEINLLYKLRSNPNVIIYEDHMVKENEKPPSWDIIIRMEYATSLTAYLSRNRLNRERIIRLGLDMLGAIDACSKNNIIHRDIKDENIFISKDNIFKLGDFGIAKELSQSGKAASFKGTPIYMSPEVFFGKKYDIRSDLYSLGIVLYKLLNKGRIPFMPPFPSKVSYSDNEISMTERLSGKLLSCPTHSGKLLGDIILKACSFNKENRYRNALEMKDCLEGALRAMDEAALNEDVTFLYGAEKHDLENKTIYMLDMSAVSDKEKDASKTIEEESVKDRYRWEIKEGIVGSQMSVSDIYKEKNDVSEKTITIFDIKNDDKVQYAKSKGRGAKADLLKNTNTAADTKEQRKNNEEDASSQKNIKPKILLTDKRKKRALVFSFVAVILTVFAISTVFIVKNNAANELKAATSTTQEIIGITSLDTKEQIKSLEVTNETSGSVIAQDIILSSNEYTLNNADVGLKIAKGSLKKDDNIKIVKIINPVAQNADCVFSKYAISIQLNESNSFIKPVQITLKYDESMIPAGLSENQIFIGFQDESGNTIIGGGELDTENNTITANSFHLSNWFTGISNTPISILGGDSVQINEFEQYKKERSVLFKDAASLILSNPKFGNLETAKKEYEKKWADLQKELAADKIIINNLENISPPAYLDKLIEFASSQGLNLTEKTILQMPPLLLSKLGYLGGAANIQCDDIVFGVLTTVPSGIIIGENILWPTSVIEKIAKMKKVLSDFRVAGMALEYLNSKDMFIADLQTAKDNGIEISQNEADKVKSIIDNAKKAISITETSAGSTTTSSTAPPATTTESPSTTLPPATTTTEPSAATTATAPPATSPPAATTTKPPANTTKPEATTTTAGATTTTAEATTTTAGATTTTAGATTTTAEATTTTAEATDPTVGGGVLP